NSQRSWPAAFSAGTPPDMATPRKPRPHALSFQTRIASVCPAVNGRERRDRPMWYTTEERIDAAECCERTGPPGADAHPGTEGHIRRGLSGRDSLREPTVAGQADHLADAGQRVRRSVRAGTTT